jgi:prepilin-type N-terminal cleavage/methylation domain-containing protein
MGSRKGFTLIELIVVVFILVIVIGIVAGGITSCAGLGRVVGGINPTKSVSSRTGKILKFGSQTNALGYYKSYEGAMQMSEFGLQSQNKSISSMNGNVWEFSLYDNADQALIDKIALAQKEQKIVTLSYQQWASRPATISTEYVITGVEFPGEETAAGAAEGKPKGR